MSGCFPPIPKFVEPYPDESCYSILCRNMVRAAMSASRFCWEMFGRWLNLTAYLWQPFRPDDVGRWFGEATGRMAIYAQAHSIFPYRYPAVNSVCKCRLRKWSEDEFLQDGKLKGLTQELGYRCWTKEHLYYCPECVRYDREKYGETYWHMIPQLPGVTVCPTHMVPLEKSALQVKDARWDLLPAEYWLTNAGAQEKNISCDELRIAADSKWLMENGWRKETNLGLLETDLSQRQFERAIAVTMRSSSRFNLKDETLYHIQLANSKGNSITEYVGQEIVRY